MDTYAPVAAWITVRIFLILTMLLGWVTISIDFANAFVQSYLPEPIWIHVPRGYKASKNYGSRTILKLKKSLYGISLAPKLWYEMLRQALIDDGFVPSKIDPCLMMKPDMLIVFYVDDAGIAAPTMEAIDALVARLQKKGFKLTTEGSFSEFLGVKFNNNPDGSVTMTQKGLIDKIIKTTGMEDCHGNWTPASQLALGSDPEGERMHEEWHYSSVVGMMIYLCTNTRPDIAFAISQVGHFSSAPKQSHAMAVKTIV